MGRCLITGASGFIGSALVKALEAQGHEVIRLKRDWKDIPDQVDFIYHLGSYGNMYYQTERNEVFKANLSRTFDLLEATKDMDYKKFVYVSSSAVNLPKQTLYSATKKAAEELTRAYDKPIVIIRPYSVTGVGEQKEHLIPTLIDAAFTGKTIPFVPHPRHDFIDIQDIVVNIMNITTPGIYGLGSGKSCSNLEVKELVEFLTGKEIKVDIKDSMREYDSENWVSQQDWSNKPLRQSIEEMINVYRQ